MLKDNFKNKKNNRLHLSKKKVNHFLAMKLHVDVANCQMAMLTLTFIYIYISLRGCMMIYMKFAISTILKCTT